MTTVGEAVATVEQHLLIARERELSEFRAWLPDAEAPKLLNVSGPPGVGKTTLLHAFAHEAQRVGRCVAAADGHSLGATPESLVASLSTTRSTDLTELIEQLNTDHAMVMLDTFEEMEHLTGFLQQNLLPHLNTNVRVVIAGRRPLVLSWHRSDGWHKIVRLLPLEGFSAPESRFYLVRRGFEASKLMDQVVRATRGNPLALSLAADIVTQFGVRDFATNSQWRIAARTLVGRLLSEAAGDPVLVSALEACSVVRVFDEATLAAITCEDYVAGAFDQLCRLSVVKPAAHGLMLHEHVRAIMGNDLAWRRPLHHQLLRRRALDHFRERLRTSSADDRTWLIAECFFLWGNTLIHDAFFASDAIDSVTVEADPEPDIAALGDLYVNEMGGAARDEDVGLLRSVLGSTGTRVRVARDQDLAPIGFSVIVPICVQSMRLLERHPVHAELLARFYVNGRREALPESSEDATAYYLLHILATGDESGAVRSALLRDLAAIFGLGGVYLCTTRDARFNQLLDACGFESMGCVVAGGDAAPAHAWVLDLTRVGFDGWIEGIIEGHPARARPDPIRLESELLGALVHWNDPDWLAANCSILAGDAQVGERAAAVRKAVESALARARTECSVAVEQALRAVELGYMKRRANHKEAMCKLAVSRATFYRLCKRGIRALADEVVARSAEKSREIETPLRLA